MSEMNLEQIKYCINDNTCEFCDFKAECHDTLNFNRLKEARIRSIKALEENEELKEELRLKNIEIAELDANRRDLVYRLNNKMSAVEALEWFATASYEDLQEVFDHTFAGDIIRSYRGRTKEIVDKITEYESGNKVTQESTKEPKSNVEDLEQHTKTCDECTHDECRYCQDYNGFRKGKNKYEEPQIEWIWECISNFTSIREFRSENEAIKWCESEAKDGRCASYRKVCMKKRR